MSTSIRAAADSILLCCRKPIDYFVLKPNSLISRSSCNVLMFGRLGDRRDPVTASALSLACEAGLPTFQMIAKFIFKDRHRLPDQPELLIGRIVAHHLVLVGMSRY